MTTINNKEILRVGSDFEGVYLKASSSSKITHKNQDKFLEKHKNIIARTSFLCFHRNKITFEKMSFELEDIENIAKYYAYVFANAHLKKFEGFSASEVERKQRNDLICYIKQRLYDLNSVSEVKLANIVCSKKKTMYFYVPKNTKVSDTPENIINSHKDYGLKKVTLSEYKKNKDKEDYIEVTKSSNYLESFDSLDRFYDNDSYTSESSSFSKNIDKTLYSEENENIYCDDPESYLIEREEEIERESSLQRISFLKSLRKNPKIKSNYPYMKKISEMIKKLSAEQGKESIINIEEQRDDG